MVTKMHSHTVILMSTDRTINHALGPRFLYKNINETQNAKHAINFRDKLCFFGSICLLSYRIRLDENIF